MRNVTYYINDVKLNRELKLHIPLRPIGIINSPYINPRCSPRQARIEGGKGTITIEEAYCDGLTGLQEFSHIIVIYYFHKQFEIKLKARPCFDPDQEHGIFASRFPTRPNHIGISILSLESIQGNILNCTDVDVLDGTPLLDIKPYVKYFDHVDNPKCGWYDQVDWTKIAIESPKIFDPLHTIMHSSVTAEI